MAAFQSTTVSSLINVNNASRIMLSQASPDIFYSVRIYWGNIKYCDEQYKWYSSHSDIIFLFTFFSQWLWSGENTVETERGKCRHIEHECHVLVLCFNVLSPDASLPVWHITTVKMKTIWYHDCTES